MDKRAEKYWDIQTGSIYSVVGVTVLGFLIVSSTSNIASADTFGNGDNTFEIEFITIGDPQNASDTTGNPATAGAVDYTYRIGRCEISQGMIEKDNQESGLGITFFDLTDCGGDAPNKSVTEIN